jgi:hypothetical protein
MNSLLVPKGHEHIHTCPACQKRFDCTYSWCSIWRLKTCDSCYRTGR